MPLIIRKKVQKGPVQPPPAPSDVVASDVVVNTVQTGVPVRPVFTKTIHVGQSEILPDIDVHDVPGRTKFLINLFKIENNVSLWYRVVGYDENTQDMKLQSRHKNTFSTKLPSTIALHYLVVMELKDATEPSKEALNAIRQMMVADPIPVAEKSADKASRKK